MMQSRADHDMEKFEFGENWSRFLRDVNEERILAAKKSLQRLFAAENLAGKRFLDIGCGSGLFSLAARLLGAEVFSFDFDENAVQCAKVLKARYHTADDGWTIRQGSALDPEFLRSLGSFDLVYSWGVLHHTGSMWQALGNAVIPVSSGGQLCVAIYNDQGVASRIWTVIKKTYMHSPKVIQLLLVFVIGIYFKLRTAIGRLLKFKNPFSSPTRERGMSDWYDLVDWVGGYPFEVAKPEAVVDFYRRKGLILERLTTCGGGLGCNEFVFKLDKKTSANGHESGQDVGDRGSRQAVLGNPPKP